MMAGNNASGHGQPEKRDRAAAEFTKGSSERRAASKGAAPQERQELPTRRELADRLEKAEAERDEYRAKLNGMAEPAKATEPVEAEVEQLKAEVARVRADFHNYRSRIERDRERDRKLLAEHTVESLIPVIDNLDRTMDAIPDRDSAVGKGIAMIHRQFVATLGELGLEKISTEGTFDPAVHEAVAVMNRPGASDGEIVEVIQTGYKLANKVLRAAKVAVAKTEN